MALLHDGDDLCSPEIVCPGRRPLTMTGIQTIMNIVSQKSWPIVFEGRALAEERETGRGRGQKELEETHVPLLRMF